MKWGSAIGGEGEMLYQTIFYRCKGCETPVTVTPTTAYCKCRFYRCRRVKRVVLDYGNKILRIEGLKAIFDGGERPLLFVGEGVEILPQRDGAVLSLDGEKFYGLRLVSSA